MTDTNGHQPEKIDILIDQVGHLTESIQELREGIHDLKDVVTTGFADLKVISERQEQNISRLVEVVNRQTEMVDRLISERQNG
jgi:uncharacterized protein YoxC